MKYVALVACLVVAAILLRGLWNMMRGGDANLSQRLMRMRVAAQAIAVVLIVGAIYFAR
ncbi:MAG: twin transmembrane helix small protein [Pseudomonadota bacterium]